jgi:hypothetical protein
MSQPVPYNPSKIAPLITIFVMLFLARGCYSSYNDRLNENKKIPLLEAMMKDNTVTIAKVDPVYKEVTMKIMGIPTKSYEVNYTYEVNGGGPYKGKRTFSSPPTSIEMPLYYSKSEPSYSSFEPEVDIKRIQEKESSKSNLYCCIGFVLLAVIVAAHYVIEARAYVNARRAMIAAEEAARRNAGNHQGN